MLEPIFEQGAPQPRFLFLWNRGAHVYQMDVVKIRFSTQRLACMIAVISPKDAFVPKDLFISLDPSFTLLHLNQ